MCIYSVVPNDLHQHLEEEDLAFYETEQTLDAGLYNNQ